MDDTELIEAYRLYLREVERKGELTIGSYVSTIERFQKYLLGTPLDRIIPDNIRGYVLFLSTEKAANNELLCSPQSIRKYYQALKNFYDIFLINKKIVSKSLLPEKITLPPVKAKNPPLYLTEPQMDTLLDYINKFKGNRGIRNRAIINLFLFTGIRLRELVSLNIGSVNFSTFRITFIQKGGKTASLTIMRKVEKVLKEWISIHPQRDDTSAPLFITTGKNRGVKRITPTAVENMVRDVCKEASIGDNIHPHTFRHTFATWLFARGKDAKVVQAAMRHTSLETTNIYAHIAEARLDKEMRDLKAPDEK